MIADKLDVLATADPLKIIALMLWKQRMREPDLYVQLEEKDIDGLQQCCDYLKVEPQVHIIRPEGTPPQPAVPASQGRRAVPAQPATPPRPFVIVALVDAKTGDRIVPVENNQEDFDLSRHAARVRKARDQAPMLAARLMEQGQIGRASCRERV